jgi:hypothetical protein
MFLEAWVFLPVFFRPSVAFVLWWLHSGDLPTTTSTTEQVGGRQGILSLLRDGDAGSTGLEG